MKAFHLIPTSNVCGYLYDEDGVHAAIYLTPGEAKFQAKFRTIHAASAPAKSEAA